MIWQNTSEFWAMGGYGVYVWGSMGVSFVALALEVALVRVGRHQALQAVCEHMDVQAEDTASQDKASQDTASQVAQGAAPAGRGSSGATS
jgi:heme exporter protein D